MFIGIEGIIAAGKSDFAQRLARVLDFEYMGEPYGENPLLPLFYQDKKRWAFSTQIGFLWRRFVQHQQAVFGCGGAMPITGNGFLEERRSCSLWRGVVQDRTIYADSIFVRMLLRQKMITQLEANEYFSLFATMRHFLDIPDGIVFLDVQPETALERVQRRARGIESDVDVDYLRALYDEYNGTFMNELIELGTAVLRLPWNADMTDERRDELIEVHVNDILSMQKGRKNRLRRSIRQL